MVAWSSSAINDNPLLSSSYWVFNGTARVDTVSPASRALAYGDGLFETMRVHRGRIPLLSLHWQRLESGLERLGIPLTNPFLKDFISQCCVHVEDAVLKVIIARGEGGRGYLPASGVDSMQIVSLHPLPRYEYDHAQHGLRIGISRLRLGKNPLLAGLKHLNRLEQVLIKRSLYDDGFVEGLVLDIDDFVIEGASSNVVIISGNKLQTPSLETAGVDGVMRRWLLARVPALGLSCHIGALRLEDVLAADEVFLCNSINGVWPVTAIENHPFLIGPWTKSIQHELACSCG